MQEAEWLNLSRNSFREKWYYQEYSQSSYSGLAGYAHSHIHKSLEAGYSNNSHFSRTLELGSNIGEHLDFVKHTFDEYLASDIDNRLEPSHVEKLLNRGARFEIQNATNLTYIDDSFDRVLHLCLLPHVQDPEEVLLEVRRVLKPGGTADIYIGSDPGWLFRFGRRFGPTRQANKKGIGKVKTLMDAREHPIHSRAIIRLLEQVFRNDEIRRKSYPLPFVPHDFTLWTHFRITKSSSKLSV